MALLRWLSVALATLATTAALHAQTASFSVLGLTSLFGQEIPPQPTLNILPWNVLTANNVLGWTLELPDFEAIDEPTDVQILSAPQRGNQSLSKCLSQCMQCWKEQWSLGNFRQAEMLAAMACKLDPNDVICRHALTLSQIMKQLSEKVPPYPLSEIIAQVVCHDGNQCPAVVTGASLNKQSAVVYSSTSGGCGSCCTTKPVVAEKTCEKCASANKSCCQVTASANKTCACAAKPDCCCAKVTQTVQAKPDCCCAKGTQTVQTKPDCCCVKSAQAKTTAPSCCCAAKAAPPKEAAKCCCGESERAVHTREVAAELLQWYRLLVTEGRYKEALIAARLAKELDPDNLAADAAIQIMLIKTPQREYQDPTAVNEVSKSGCCSDCCPKSAPAKKAQSVFLPPTPFTVVGESSDANAPCPFLERLRTVMTLPMQGTRTVSSTAYPPPPNPVTMLPGFPGLPVPAPGFGGPGLPTPEQVMRDLDMVRNAAMQKARWQVSAMQSPAVAKHNVHLVVANMEAHCERLASSPNSDQMVLEGDVHLTCKRNGQTMQIQGQRVVVNLADGSFAVESMRMVAIPTMRIPVPMAPPQPASYTMPSARDLTPPAPFAPPGRDDGADRDDD